MVVPHRSEPLFLACNRYTAALDRHPCMSWRADWWRGRCFEGSYSYLDNRWSQGLYEMKRTLADGGLALLRTRSVRPSIGVLNGESVTLGSGGYSCIFCSAFLDFSSLREFLMLSKSLLLA